MAEVEVGVVTRDRLSADDAPESVANARLRLSVIYIGKLQVGIGKNPGVTLVRRPCVRVIADYATEGRSYASRDGVDRGDGDLDD